LSDSKSQQNPDTTPTFLADLSEKDKSWDSHRCKTTQLERIYHYSESHQDYAERMNVCSTFLDFRLVPGEEELKLKLSHAMFCHVRLCPVCQWRRSLNWHRKALTIIPKVLEAYPTYRWLFLTLTAKHIPASDLRAELKHLNESFKRLSKLKDFPGEGWIKCVEVTPSKTTKGYAHPHLHVLMIVKSTYFSANYLSLEKWRAMWEKSARLDYRSQVDVTTFKQPKEELNGIKSLACMLCETIKYQVKESDLTRDPKWTLELTEQLKGTRAISTGGILKSYFRELEDEPEDLIGKDDENEEMLGHVFAMWRRDCQRYVIK
jgi:plasmid rolling circle replication initiator protein Rep